jgi:antitoxin component YwqK of YwqJK toxin-antitoxin module
MSSYRTPTYQLKILFTFLIGLMLQACTYHTPDPVSEKADPYNGVRKSYRKDGTLLAEVTYRDSIRNGIARNFYPNGKVQLEMEYVDGIRHGESRVFYQNGELYQTTTYVNGKKQGTRRKYYEGGMLMAEIPFENDVQVPGLLEYSKAGKPLKRDAKIVFRLVDKTAFENLFELEITLSDGWEYVEFYRYFPDEGKGTEVSYQIKTVNGKAIESFYVPPGHFNQQTINIRAERTTRLKNKEYYYGKYCLDVENKKRFQ